MPTKPCPFCAEEIQAEAIKCKHCGCWLSAPPGGSPAGPTILESLGSKRLERSATNSMIAGVCGGLGRYLGIDPTLVRLLFALGTFFTAVAPGVIVYVILAFVCPVEADPSWK